VSTRRDDGGIAAHPRIAFLSYSTAEYDARTFRMARAALAAGYEVTVYARHKPGLPIVQEHDGYRIVRAQTDWRLRVPWLRAGARRRLVAAIEAMDAPASATAARSASPGPPTAADDGQAVNSTMTAAHTRFELARRIYHAMRRPFRPLARWSRIITMFPLRPLSWAAAVEAVAAPADIWHGMWAGSLPALSRLRARHGGRTIYDSRDVYMLSRDFYRLERPLRPLLVGLERRWARAADRVLTVNDAYADLLVGSLGIERPAVVLNCPEAWTPPEPAPNRLREALGLDLDTAVVLYQGQLIGERGIEQAMDAILAVPDAVLVLMGYGRDKYYQSMVAAPPYLGRVFVLPPVPPSELLTWTASADVTVMPIQPTTDNHRYTTPQKLFESIAAGVPVVASDLPAMSAVVRSCGVGIACDPVSIDEIAAAIRSLVEVPETERSAMRAHILAVAHQTFNWESQVATLFGLYAALAPAPPGVAHDQAWGAAQ
jgi:glycosyltransferase involved in cell wall biosynthesis